MHQTFWTFQAFHTIFSTVYSLAFSSSSGERRVLSTSIASWQFHMFLAHHKFSFVAPSSNRSGFFRTEQKNTYKRLISYRNRRTFYVSQRWHISSRQQWMAKPIAATNAMFLCDCYCFSRDWPYAFSIRCFWLRLRWFRSSHDIYIALFLVWEVQLSFSKAWQGHVKIPKRYDFS